MIKAGWSAALADLVKELQAKSGVDLGPFVEKWLKGTGYPTLKVTSAVTAAASGWEVVLGLTGDDFPMSLPLRLRHSDGTVEKQVLSYQDGRGKAQLQTTARPAVIELDPGWTAVREVRPAVEGDVSLDGQVDGADLIEVALRLGGYLPSTRRVDGKYDPLHDVDGDRALADADLDRVVTLAAK